MTEQEFQMDLDDPDPSTISNDTRTNNGSVFEYSDDEKLESRYESEFYGNVDNNGNISNDERDFIGGYSVDLNGNSYITSKEYENFQRKRKILQREADHSNEIDGINVKIRKDLEIDDTITDDSKYKNGSKPDKEREDIDVEEELTPPENFSPVIGEIYRSSFPRLENFKFLTKLKLKSILILIPEEYPKENLKFVEESNIKIFQVGMSGNKEPFVKISHDLLTKALEIAINPENHPLLIHCNRGKHRTGCLVGCIRRLQNWSLTMILDEYRRFAAPKIRPLDQQFIEMYNEDEIVEIATKNGWLPLRW